MVQPWNGWPVPMMPIRRSSAIFCRIFTSPYGAASKDSMAAVRSAPGFTGSPITEGRRTSRVGAVQERNRWSAWEELENLPDANSGQQVADRSHDLDRLLSLIQRLKPLDRHVILSYLEGVDAASIGEITGLSSGNVATKIHRIKSLLARQFQQGGKTHA